LKFVQPEAIYYQKGIISVYDVIKLKAERKKREASTLKKSNMSSDSSIESKTAPHIFPSIFIERRNSRKKSDPTDDKFKIF